jgi:hypothetical protein
MGLADRDYMRRKPPPDLGIGSRGLTLLIVALVTAAFLAYSYIHFSVVIPGVGGVPEKGSLVVNLNTATKEELESLPGIGPALSSRIVAARPFGSISELAPVRGIGQRHATTGGSVDNRLGYLVRDAMVSRLTSTVA